MNDADLFQMIQSCTQHVIGLPEVVEGSAEGQWPIPQMVRWMILQHNITDWFLWTVSYILAFST